MISVSLPAASIVMLPADVVSKTAASPIVKSSAALDTVSKDKADTLFKLLNILEENEDVQAVSSNFDVSDEVLASLTA